MALRKQLGSAEEQCLSSLCGRGHGDFAKTLEQLCLTPQGANALPSQQ